MFLLLLNNNNLLLGNIPEVAGLLMFGIGLIAMTILFRWFINKDNSDEVIGEDKPEK